MTIPNRVRHGATMVAVEYGICYVRAGAQSDAAQLDARGKWIYSPSPRSRPPWPTVLAGVCRVTPDGVEWTAR